jgi:N-acetylmuramic acid 6-phosphate etherase
VINLNVNEFLKLEKQYCLGQLTTESLHPKSTNLSHEVNLNIPQAIKTLNSIDIDALRILQQRSSEIYKLQMKLNHILATGNRVFLCGCGATGRLSLVLEKLYREMRGGDQVVGLMAGGDYALIRSVESFEDNADFGVKQLNELNFKAEDILLGITEGGETPFVIGATLEAQKRSKHDPYFIYCNPDDELMNIDRSNDIIKNPSVKKINLTTGPMAISGSTRMQASTVQMIAVGFALLFEHQDFYSFQKDFNSFIDQLTKINMNFLEDFIKQESDIYKKSGIVTYRSDPELAITILTDTTERSPTFSLYSFENQKQEHLSLCYLAVEGVNQSQEAWARLLGRTPRCLDWDNMDRDISLETIYAFDISERAILRRSASNNAHATFLVERSDNTVLFRLNEHEHTLKLNRSNLFFIHMSMKLILNTHSTLVMGRMGRFDGNMMTFVRPSNYKLIDRAARYIVEILKRKNIYPPREKILSEIFKRINDQESSIVYSVTNHFQ